MIENDSYRTILRASKEVLYKDKNSKFYGYAYPVSTEEAVKYHIDQLKKRHRSAGHWCYAYQIGKLENDLYFRANDDGEPNNSAGMPIYGQIQSFKVTNVLIVVVRYFGGTKLGVSGLISAYRTTAQMALESSKIVVETINVKYDITFEYKSMNKVMRLIKERNLNVIQQVLDLNCAITVSVRFRDAPSIFALFGTLHDVNIAEVDD